MAQNKGKPLTYLRLNHDKNIKIQGLLWGQKFVIDLIAKVIANGKRATKDQCEVIFRQEGTKEIGRAKTDSDGIARFTWVTLSTDYLRRDFAGREVTITADTIVDDKDAEDEEKIMLNLPAGDLIKGIQTFWVRRYHHLGDIIKAIAAATLMVFLIGYAGEGKMNVLLGLLTGIISAHILFYVLTKFFPDVPRMVKTLIALTIPVWAWFDPELITGPMLFAVKYSFIVGGIFYFAEEFWRRADGRPVLNLYPWFPLVISLSMIIFSSFDFFGMFVPDYQQGQPNKIVFGQGLSSNVISFGDQPETTDLLKPHHPWWINWAKIILLSIPLIGSFYAEMLTTSWLGHTFSIIFLAPYAIPSELWEKVTGRSRVKVGETDVTSAILIVELLRYFRDWLTGMGVSRARGGK